MDKNIMSIYGWILVTLLCMGTLVVFATPFGNLAVEQTGYLIEDMIDKSFDDGVGPALDTPQLALSGDILTITEVKGATGYEIYNGFNLLTVITEGEKVVDLSTYITSPGQYVIKVYCTSSKGFSDIAAMGYIVE